MYYLRVHLTYGTYIYPKFCDTYILHMVLYMCILCILRNQLFRFILNNKGDKSLSLQYHFNIPKQMKKSILYFVFLCGFVFVQSCSMIMPDDEDSEIEGGEEITKIELTAPQMTLVSISTSQYLSEDTYQGFLNNTFFTVYKEGDTTLTFLAPVIAPGLYELSLAELNLEVSLTIVETTLPESAEKTIQTFTDDLTAIYDELKDGSDNDLQLNAILSTYTQALAEASEQEKLEFALFYQANKEAFNNVMYPENLSSKSEHVVKFKQSVSLFLISLAGIVISGEVLFSPAADVPLIGLASLAGIVVSAVGIKTAYFDAKNSPVKVVELIIDEFQGELENQLKSAGQTIEFTNGVTKELSLNGTLLSVTTEDEGESAFANFFKGYRQYTSLVEKINSAVKYVNSKYSFSDIPLIEMDEVTTTGTSGTFAVNNENFDNYSISISNSYVDGDFGLEEDGKISITLTVSESVDLSEPLATELNVFYEDEFGEYFSKVDILISEKKFDYEGTWILSWISSDGSGLYQDQKIVFNANGESTFFQNKMYGGDQGWVTNTIDFWTLKYKNGYLYLQNHSYSHYHTFKVYSTEDTFFEATYREGDLWRKELRRE